MNEEKITKDWYELLRNKIIELQAELQLYVDILEAKEGKKYSEEEIKDLLSLDEEDDFPNADSAWKEAYGDEWDEEEDK